MCNDANVLYLTPCTESEQFNILCGLELHVHVATTISSQLVIRGFGECSTFPIQ